MEPEGCVESSSIPPIRVHFVPQFGVDKEEARTHEKLLRGRSHFGETSQETAPQTPKGVGLQAGAGRWGRRITQVWQSAGGGPRLSPTLIAFPSRIVRFPLWESEDVARPGTGELSRGESAVGRSCRRSPASMPFPECCRPSGYCFRPRKCFRSCSWFLVLRVGHKGPPPASTTPVTMEAKKRTTAHGTGQAANADRVPRQLQHAASRLWSLQATQALPSTLESGPKRLEQEP